MSNRPFFPRSCASSNPAADPSAPVADSGFAASRSPISRRALVRGASFVAVLGALAGTSQMPSVLADDRKRKEEEKQSVDQQLETLRGDLHEVDGELAEAYLALAETELRIPEAQTRMDEARIAAEQARIEDEKLARRLTTAEEEERTLLGQLETGAADIERSDTQVSQASMEAYKGSGVPNPATVYLGAADPQDAVDRSMNYRLTLQAQGERLSDLRDTRSVNVTAADRLEAVRIEIADLKERSAAAVLERERAEAEATTAKRELDALYESQKTQTTNLETLKAQYQQSETELNSRSSQLDSEIQALIQQEKAAAQASSTSAGSGGGSGGSGAFINPVSARRSSMFGNRIHPIYRTPRLHAGMDYAAACGTPCGAMAAGKVIATTFNSGAGNKVIVSHGLYNGQLLTTSYHHLQGFAVRTGQSVAQGETVGYVGTTGSSTGCHLHFETHLDGTAVDPRNFLG